MLHVLPRIFLYTVLCMLVWSTVQCPYILSVQCTPFGQLTIAWNQVYYTCSTVFVVHMWFFRFPGSDRGFGEAEAKSCQCENVIIQLVVAEYAVKLQSLLPPVLHGWIIETGISKHNFASWAADKDHHHHCTARWSNNYSYPVESSSIYIANRSHTRTGGS